MKTNWRFTLNLEAMLLEKDENSFVKDLLSLWQIWYVFPHYYNDDDTISSYAWLVVTTKNKNIIERVEYVKEIYKIEPTNIFENDWIYHIVFELNKGIAQNQYKQYQKALEFIYSAKSIEYHFYAKSDKVNKVYSCEKKSSPITVLSNIYVLIQNKNIERDFDKHNLEEYNKTLDLSFEEISGKLLDSSCMKSIDEETWININVWNQFSYVVDFLQSKVEAFAFFNNEFWLSFDIDEDSTNKIVPREWVSIIDGWWFFSNSRGYYIMDKDWKDIQITDFYIKVHYRLIKSDKEKVFIVSLHNETNDERTEKIEWTNVTNKWPFSDFLQKMWAFHFTGINQSFIASLHKKICKAPVPDVKYIIWFWFHKDEWIIIFKNWIWDIKEKVFTPIIEWDKYYFNYNGKWYYPSDKMGNSLLETIWVFVPSMGERKLIELDDSFEFMNKIYADMSGSLLLMYVMWVLGNGLFSATTGFFPILFIHWLTWSWKTKYSEILQYIFWTNKPSGFESSSVFTMTMLFTYLIDFPYFISEYRENAKDRQGKTTILMQNYDATGGTKGRPDQTLINYAYRAIPIMDWQEMVTEPALRTRSLQLRFLSKHKIKWNFESIYNKGKWTLSWFMYTYLNLANGDLYEQDKEDWYEIFQSNSNRIRQNMAAIYAGCMAFKRDKKDTYIEVLSDSLKLQNIDYWDNWDDMQIIKAITKFLEADRDNYDAIWDIQPTEEYPIWCLIISWSRLEEYIKSKRVELSLKIDTYKSSLENMWYVIWEREDSTEEKIRAGIIIPYDNIPTHFRVHSKFFKAHKWQKQQEKQKTLDF